MVCESCKKGKIVMHAFSEGECEKCGDRVVTPHIPCDKVCKSCSDTLSLCKECGVEIKK